MTKITLDRVDAKLRVDPGMPLPWALSDCAVHKAWIQESHQRL